jgi:hypothetical protein
MHARHTLCEGAGALGVGHALVGGLAAHALPLLSLLPLWLQGSQGPGGHGRQGPCARHHVTAGHTDTCRFVSHTQHVPMPNHSPTIAGDSVRPERAVITNGHITEIRAPTAQSLGGG